MVFCVGKLIENLKLFYTSNRPHFLWGYRRDNPRGMLLIGRTLEKLVHQSPSATSFSRVLPTSSEGYYAGKTIEKYGLLLKNNLETFVIEMAQERFNKLKKKMERHPNKISDKSTKSTRLWRYTVCIN